MSRKEKKENHKEHRLKRSHSSHSSVNSLHVNAFIVFHATSVLSSKDGHHLKLLYIHSYLSRRRRNLAVEAGKGRWWQSPVVQYVLNSDAVAWIQQQQECVFSITLCVLIHWLALPLSASSLLSAARQPREHTQARASRPRAHPNQLSSARSS